MNFFSDLTVGMGTSNAASAISLQRMQFLCFELTTNTNGRPKFDFKKERHHNEKKIIEVFFCSIKFF